MNLEKMIEMQKELDAHITKKKGLNETGNHDWKTLALDVELSELANEWRGFKKWSENQDPRTKEIIECVSCIGTGDSNAEVNVEMMMEGKDGVPYLACDDCDETGVSGYRNPLLEEYADCVSFFLSIANEKEWQERLYLHEEAIWELEEAGLQGGVTGALLETKYHLLKSFIETKPDESIERFYGMTKQEFHFRSAWFVFIAIGLIGFKFTEEQIGQAYFDKNKVNHERQQNGY